MGRAVGLKVVAGSVAATLPGVLDSHLAVSFGYGLAMLWISLERRWEHMADDSSSQLCFIDDV